MTTGKILACLALLLLGFVGLAMTVCGGGFVLAIVGSHTWAQGGLLVLWIALAALASGLTVLYFTWRAMRVISKE